MVRTLLCAVAVAGTLPVLLLVLDLKTSASGAGLPRASRYTWRDGVIRQLDRGSNFRPARDTGITRDSID
jgi:hypothetical protein